MATATARSTMARNVRHVWIAVLLSALLYQSAFADNVVVSETEAHAIIENRWVKVVLSKDDGTYQAVDKRDQSICISNAIFQINDHASADYDHFESSQVVVYDRLGKGKKLVVTGTSAKKLSLILEIGLYEDRSFISLNVGIDNVRDSDIRIMEFSPMKGNTFEALENE